MSESTGVPERRDCFQELEVFADSIPAQLAGILATGEAFDEEFQAARDRAVAILSQERGWAPESRFPCFPSGTYDFGATWIGGVLDGDVPDEDGEAEEYRTDKISYEDSTEDAADRGKRLERFYGKPDFLADWAIDMARLVDLLAEDGFPMWCGIYVDGGNAYVEIYRQAEPDGPNNIPNVFEIKVDEEGVEDDGEIEDEEETYNVRISDRCVIEDGCTRVDILRLRELLAAQESKPSELTTESVADPNAGTPITDS